MEFQSLDFLKINTIATIIKGKIKTCPKIKLIEPFEIIKDRYEFIENNISVKIINHKLGFVTISFGFRFKYQILGIIPKTTTINKKTNTLTISICYLMLPLVKFIIYLNINFANS